MLYIAYVSYLGYRFSIYNAVYPKRVAQSGWLGVFEEREGLPTGRQRSAFSRGIGGGGLRAARPGLVVWAFPHLR